jgi:hypothetical protein
MNIISANRFEMLFPDLADIHIEDIRNAMQTRNVDEALEIVDVAVGHFGTETIRGNWVDNYCQEIQLLYSASGDDDKPTLVFDIERICIPYRNIVRPFTCNMDTPTLPSVRAAHA